MAINSYFFNAIVDGQGNYDRVYNAEDMTGYLEKIVGNGVFGDVSTALQVMAAGGFGIVVKSGQGFIDGHKMVSDADLPLTVAGSDVLLNRIDRVIFYVDYDAREMGIAVKQGTAATQAIAPALTRSATRYEMGLAEVTVAAQATEVTQANIRDTRGDASVCGYVAGLVEQLDFSTAQAQQQAQFDAWFQEVKTELASATLLTKLEQVFTTTSEAVSSFDVTDYIPGYKWAIDILEIYVDGLRLDATEYAENQNIVTLATPITHAGTEVSLVVYKSIDGSDAESVIGQVEEQQYVIDALQTGMYIATGADDNIKLSEIVRNFLEGGDDYRQLEIQVYGDLAVTQPCNGEYWFDFGLFAATQRRVRLDFAHASRIVIDNTGRSSSVLFGASDIEIANLQAVMNNVTSGTLIEGFATCVDCAFWLNGQGSGTLKGAEEGDFTRCRFSVTNEQGAAYGVSANGNVLKLTDCELLAYNKSAASAESVAVHVQANQTQNVLTMTNCSCPMRARGGYKQSNAVKVNSGFFCLVGNMLGKAAALYATGDGKTEIGTMIVSK